MRHKKDMSKAELREQLLKDQTEFLEAGNSVKKCRAGKRKTEKVHGKILVNDPKGGLHPSPLNVKEMCCGIHKISAETPETGPRPIRIHKEFD